MAVSISEFWRLAAESRLMTAEQCRQYATSFGQIKGAGDSDAKVLAEWLISQNALTQYQAMILLAGHSGPFFYADYKVYDRVDRAPWTGVFRAVHTPTGHPVMLQFLTGAVTENPQQWSALQSRIQIQRRIMHPNLLRCFSLVDTTSFKFVVIEDVRGQSVEQMISGGKRLPPQEACRIARNAASALAYLHQMNLPHGSATPTNLWIEPSGNVKLARDVVHGAQPVNLSQPDQQGQLLARADYLAPEFTQAGKKPDALTDIYALGCSLYQMLAGRPPFPGGDIHQKMQQHAMQPIQPLEHMGVPQPIAQLVMYMMAKNPSVRYQHAAQVAEQLTPFVDPNRLEIPASPPPTLPAFERAVQASSMSAPASGSPVAARPSAPVRAQPIPVSAASARSSPTASPVASGAGGSARPVVAAGVKAAPVAGGSPVASMAASRYGKKKPSEKDVIKKAVIGLVATAAVLITGLIVLNSMGGGDANNDGDQSVVDNPTTDTDTNTSPADPPKDTQNGSGKTTTTASNAERFVVVADDGQLPWAPPTSGSPIDLKYVAPGSQFYIIVRPAEMAATSEGQRVFQSLGPIFSQTVSAWQSTTGIALDEVEQLIVTLHDNGTSFPQPSIVVRLREPVPQAALLSQLGNPAAADEDGKQYYSGANGWNYLLPKDAGDQLFVMAPAPQIRDILRFDGAAPNLFGAMEKLLAASDAKRHFTILFSPNELVSNLFRDGRQLSLCEPRKIREALDWFLGDGVEAGMASAHFDDSTYLELLMVGRVGRQKNALATDMQNRLRQMPDLIEEYVASLNPHPYWRTIAFRYPSMIRYLHRQTRIGAEDEFAVINAVLPPTAAHNLVFASEMALSSTPSPATTTVVSTTPQAPQSIAEMLNVKMSIAFGQDSLEFSMQNIQAEARDLFPNLPFPFAIKILGGDLEKNGITRNQQIRDFNEQNKTVAEILTAMVMKANPIKTVKEPHETDQQLIWVIGPNPDNASEQIILITTRDAAAAKNYTLPAIFQPK